MAAWHRSRRADLGLRAIGLGLCVVAYLTIARLYVLQIPTQSAGLGAYALAAAGFLCGSAGSAMTTLGRHLFDDVEVSARWRAFLPEKAAPFADPLFCHLARRDHASNV